MITIIRKELADYFTSIRCFILFLLVLLASAAGLYAAYQGIRGVDTSTGFVFVRLFTTSGESIPSLVSFIGIFVPVIGIALGFDAINREYSSGTMSRILSQPVYRDSVINGKFLAGMITLAIMMATTLLLVSGFGLRMIGVAPSAEEIIRLFIYFVSIVIFGAFWMGLAILFSVIIRNLAVSLLASLAVWLFFGFFYTLLIVPAVAKSVDLYLLLVRLSPNTLFDEATMAMLLPQSRGLGLFASSEISYMILNPLPLGQSLLLVWPQLVTMIGLAAVCFAVSYVVFMRQEIRAT
jgi:ABC-2 type transport system permease protein